MLYPSISRSKGQTLASFYKKLFKLTLTGGAAFWTMDFLISVSRIATEYEAAFSITSLPLALVEALVGGVVIALCVSLVMMHFYVRLPSENSISKALILSIIAMFMIEILSTLLNPNNAKVFLLIDTGMNLPRFIALGMAVGYLYKKVN